MDRLNPSMSQFSDEEEAENFPEDHFGSDDELYDSEFGSVIHDLRSTEYNDENDKPEVSVNHNLTTITEESIADDFGNISFKPATNFLQVFDEDQQRVAWENLLRVPDQPTEEMLKKQYSWEPSLLNSPPVIVNELNVSNNMERSRIRTNHNRSLRNQSAVAEREKSPANEIRGGKSTRIPIRRPKQSVLFSKMEVSRSKIDQIGERQEKTSRLKIVESIPSMNEDHIPKQVNLVQELNEGEDEEKENYQPNKTPNKNTDFSATIVSMTGHAVSTPKDSSEDASNDLSMLCRSISTIGEVSPKVRPNFVDSRRFMLRQLETSKANASRAILKTIPETLSSTAIDRALSDPECRTVISDATDIQQKFVRKIRQHGSPQKNLRAHQTGDKLTDLKNRLGKQLNASKRMRSNLTESRGSLLQHHEKSRASRAVLQTIPETLSSTAIDRALSDPEVHTVISDATEVQQKLAFKILRHGSSRFYPSRDPLADLKNRMEKQLNASKRKRQLTKLQQL